MKKSSRSKGPSKRGSLISKVKVASGIGILNAEVFISER
jgi:hypothetical protein